MSRELKSAEEIQTEVQRRIDLRMSENGDRDSVRAHKPVPLAEPDRNDCNWVLEGFAGDRSYGELVGLAILETKERMNLG